MVSKFEDVEFNLLSASVGTITEGDIKEALMLKATILAMDVKCNTIAEQMARQNNVSIKYHRIIYSIIDEIKAMLQEKSKGHAS